MSGPSPRPSIANHDRPEPGPSMTKFSDSSHKRNISFDDKPRVPGARRKSIQFNVGFTETQLPSRSSSFSKRRPDGEAQRDFELVEREQRPLSTAIRVPSPPPPKTYERGVSFDTFDNRDAADFSLTLNYKHKGYQSTRRSRTFLCGTDQNDYSEFALEWLLDEMLDDGDEIVCLRAVEKDSRMASDASIIEGKYREEAEKLFESVIRKNSQDEKAISLILELAVGKVEDIIQRMIRIYEPAMLVVGTRGRNLKGVHSLLPSGSVSKWCLQQSPIPVIVVRPSPKREKKKKKRRADPARKSYNQLLSLSVKRGGRIFDESWSAESTASKLPDEEAAVAEALGLPATYSVAGTSRSSLSVSDRSSITYLDDSENPQSPVPYSLDSVLMKSPLVRSPASSEESVGTEPKRSSSPYPRSESERERERERESEQEHEHEPPSPLSEDSSDESHVTNESTPKIPALPRRVSIPSIEVSDGSNI
ncbi:hypothetical protein N7495_000122 [Penicillium taxi]|uniref:uncharacterized protein n=1 Tax=Penicillium taxi TaxID=168475 RepID=UPI0025454230|nr:uncharacterized protein N7495_000122 [Penicillium taxi]KAJ5907440.1 hypothetical protein N7495_000122 [Penicillium taxi]